MFLTTFYIVKLIIQTMTSCSSNRICKEMYRIWRKENKVIKVEK